MKALKTYYRVLALVLTSGTNYLTAGVGAVCPPAPYSAFTQAQGTPLSFPGASVATPIKAVQHEDIEIEETEERTSLRKYLDNGAIAVRFLYTLSPGYTLLSDAVAPASLHSTREPLHLLFGVLRV